LKLNSFLLLIGRFDDDGVVGTEELGVVGGILRGEKGLKEKDDAAPPLFGTGIGDVNPPCCSLATTELLLELNDDKNDDDDDDFKCMIIKIK